MSWLARWPSTPGVCIDIDIKVYTWACACMSPCMSYHADRQSTAWNLNELDGHSGYSTVNAPFKRANLQLAISLFSSWLARWMQSLRLLLLLTIICSRMCMCSFNIFLAVFSIAWDWTRNSYVVHVRVWHIGLLIVYRCWNSRLFVSLLFCFYDAVYNWSANLWLN